MIHEVGANAGPIQLHRDAVLAQMLARTDARQHQQPWRVERAGGNNDVVGGDRLD